MAQPSLKILMHLNPMKFAEGVYSVVERLRPLQFAVWLDSCGLRLPTDSSQLKRRKKQPVSWPECVEL